ncbi:hypothetical protein SAMN03159307_01881 [Pseudomonas sp. NFACC46-3]|nr:hypothetical protein SAMN03159307_01881 [Pseudomonas sp. NFACC46-3]
MLDQDDKKNTRLDMSERENSELTQDERKILTWYREMSEVDRGYIRHVAQLLASALLCVES